MTNRLTRFLALLVLAATLAGCGFNDFQRLDEQTQSAWSEVVNQYQRRADLIDNLVATVKGETDFERGTLNDVINARARATSIQVTPETLENPQAFQQFQEAQGELSSALSRLMVTVERYPDLKANQAFADLRVALEGTENRIAVARGHYIDAVREYNVLARSFPTNLTAMVLRYKPKQNFRVADEAGIARPPQVDFGTSQPAGR
ncbi:MAG: LemA family protein [Ottowia sp.]|nr:LemA family protein [Ottowia sp.]